MFDYPIIWEWLSLGTRWVHIITAIAWIGSSFYFIALDLGLRRREGMPEGAHGEEWQVHGGGFYHIQKYLVAPAAMPEHLTWFKWESYATWLSGFTLLMLVYYGGAELYLINTDAMEISIWVGICISLVSIFGGWFAYDLLCKSKFGQDNTRLMILLYVILVAMAWGFTQVFTGRATFLHLGAITATIMSANVFITIIPNQKIVVADLIAGRKPDPKYGKIAKQRSTHNNYLTLPVIFLMLSNHYPMAFATEFNWIIASLVFLMGVTIRHYFNSKHARSGDPKWTWVATTVLFLIIMWLSTVPKVLTGDVEVSLSEREQTLVASVHFDDVRDTVLGRCSMCHGAEVYWDGIATAPKDVLLEEDHQIAARARDIYLQAGRSHAMPPGNITYMEPTERALIVAWYEGAMAE
ncbi:MAG: urate hydroxylase PuuD [Alphaproteobacteria bacterium]